MWKNLKKRKERRKNKNKTGIGKTWRMLVKGNNLKHAFGVMVVCLGVMLISLVILGNKTGISQSELDVQSKAMEKSFERVSKGHIGGNQKLVTEPYKNEVKVDEFKDELDKTEKINVYFYSPYCPYCYEVGDDVVRAMEESEDDFIVVDVNEEKEFQDENNAGEVPKVVKYEDGGVEDSLVGKHDLEEYKEFLK